MNTKFFLTVILIAIILGGITVINDVKKNQEQPPKETPLPQQKTETPIISVTSSGFSPNIIKVKKGALVAWRNNSESVVSINSDNHPKHEIFPLLNLGDISIGGAKGFIFKTPGTYRYHNHHNPSQTGRVVVE